MCGIAGFLEQRLADARGATDTIEAMTDLMIRRGPDGSGAWSDLDAGVVLGHRRLSILDLSDAGRQPMVSSDGRYVVTYNGEIYNHGELARRLESVGVRFRGHSDTEVLVEAFARWGVDDTLDAIDAMFAVAVWDRQRQRLTLARDRLGEKPLFYAALSGGGVAFASTLEAVCAHPRVERRVDPDALGLFLRYNYVPAPWSMVAGVHKLPPGTKVDFELGRSLGDPEAYWSYFDVVASSERFSGSDRDAVERLTELLETSLDERLVADVPVGAFLSGGIDSSTVVGIAQRRSSTPLKTFTIGSPHADFDESDAAKAIAGHLGTDHHTLIVGDDDARSVIPRVIEASDEPLGDASQIPTLLVSELARSKVTVAISGDAGDELFGGYNRYLTTPSLRSRAGSVPSPLCTGAGRVLERVPMGAWDRVAAALPASKRPQQLGLKVHKALRAITAVDDRDAFLRVVAHWEQAQHIARGARSLDTEHTASRFWGSSHSFVRQMMGVDALTYLPDDILTKVDRAAMSVSLETRVPFLSRSIVEFAASLPDDMLIRNGESKWVLRRVLEDLVPQRLTDRPKSGFGLPIDAWLRGPLHDWSDHLLHSRALGEHVDLGPIEQRWSQHLSGRTNAGYDLWGVLMVAAWLERDGS